MIESMIERIKAALYSCGLMDDDCSDRDLTSVARAVLTAMREPTEAMALAGDDHCWEDMGGPGETDPRGTPAACWRSMIDKALEGENCLVLASRCG